MSLLTSPIDRHERSRDIGGTKLTRQAARTIPWPYNTTPGGALDVLLAEDDTAFVAEDDGNIVLENGDT